MSADPANPQTREPTRPRTCLPEPREISLSWLVPGELSSLLAALFSQGWRQRPTPCGSTA